ncbi:DEAD/DEAH box helicase [Deferrisoma palaeochoriense]
MKKELFGAKEKLLLLQLMTRQAVAERLEPGRDIKGGDGSGGGSGAPDEVPARWRLVPENIELHRWQRECLEVWLKKGRGTIKVATGAGKTLFALAAIQEAQQRLERDLRVAIVVPTIPLMNQWRDELSRSNLPEGAIACLGGGRDIESLESVRIVISVLASARKRLPELVRRARWSERMMLVVDECHRAQASMARRIFETNPRYTLGLSATPEGSTDAAAGSDGFAESAVGQGVGPVIYELSVKQCLDEGLLTPFEVWHIGVPLTPEEREQYERLSREISELRKDLQVRHRRSRSRQGFLAWCQTQASRGGELANEAARFIGLANRRKRLLYRARARVEVTRGLLAGEAAGSDRRVILFHESIEETERIYFAILEDGLPAVLEHSMLPGSLRVENIEAFRTGVAKIIVSAKSLVEGFDVPSADLGVIVASSSSVRQRIQSLGRMLRKSPRGGEARVVVLYVRDTEDETIYELADWHEIIGASRNRYFHWDFPRNGQFWANTLEEVGTPPRQYRPPAQAVDGAQLGRGDPFPGRPEGIDVRVDQERNLRSEDGEIIPAPQDLIDEILLRNRYRRARLTSAGHLIVRTDATGTNRGEHWMFLGMVRQDESAPRASRAEVYRIRMRRGRREIEASRGRNLTVYALGRDQGASPEAAEAKRALLDWIREEEGRAGVQITRLYWDGEGKYWVEVRGQRIAFPRKLGALEFPR